MPRPHYPTSHTWLGVWLLVAPLCCSGAVITGTISVTCTDPSGTTTNSITPPGEVTCGSIGSPFQLEPYAIASVSSSDFSVSGTGRAEGFLVGPGLPPRSDGYSINATFTNQYVLTGGTGDAQIAASFGQLTPEINCNATINGSPAGSCQALTPFGYGNPVTITFGIPFTVTVNIFGSGSSSGIATAIGGSTFSLDIRQITRDGSPVAGTLLVVPEPSTGVLGLLGLAGLALSRYRLLRTA